LPSNDPSPVPSPTVVVDVAERPNGSTAPAPAIHLERVSLSLESRAGSVSILDAVDLEVPTGRSVAVVGPSGSGKTSLLMIVAGLERPTAGKVVVAGHDLAALAAGPFGEDHLAAVRGRNIGIVFQSFHLVHTMTALENVALPLQLAGRSDAFDVARALLDEVGLAERRHHLPAELSGGEQQRVALARALAPSPPILLADEPTGNLDGRTGAHIVDLLFALQRERGATLLLVTHDLVLAERCDVVVRMADGRIVASETSERGSRRAVGQPNRP
jgi:putative ABC transport system ATP-binding protein